MPFKDPQEWLSDTKIYFLRWFITMSIIQIE